MLNASQEQSEQPELAARSGQLLPWLVQMVAGTASEIDLQALLQTLIDTTYGTQDALAKAIGISPSRISRVLKNPDSLSVENCLKLAKVTGLAPDEIFRAAGKSEVNALIRELYGDAASARRRDDELDMSDETRRALKRLLELWAKDPIRTRRKSRSKR